ncbi:MAG: hypothetical protein ABIP29_10760, partial [Candidatus Eisenbacteria bacterium]
MRRRAAAGTAILGLTCAFVLASCGSDDQAPLAPLPADTTSSMLAIDGEPRVSVALDGYLVEEASGGALSGAFRAIILDSTGQRVFPPRVSMNGVALVEERDGLGNPAFLTLDVATALPGLALDDTLVFAVEDGGAVTPPFRLLL